jgi:hypothetical protein
VKEKRYKQADVPYYMGGQALGKLLPDVWVCMDCGAGIPMNDAYAVIHDNFHDSIDEVRNWAFNQGAFSD